MIGFVVTVAVIVFAMGCGLAAARDQWKASGSLDGLWTIAIMEGALAFVLFRMVV
jgi:hypothetical protein